MKKTKGGDAVVATGSPPNLYNNTRMIASITLTSRVLQQQNRRRLVFRLSSTIRRLLAQNGAMAYSRTAIMEFTAAGQSEIFTHIPN